MAQIENREQFKKWLENKPAEWAQALAIRSGLRALPIGLDPSMFTERAIPPDFAAAVMRATIISWAARHCPDHDRVAEAARAAADDAANAADAAGYAAIAAAAAADATTYAA